MGTLYIDTGGSATNSGSRDANSAALSGSAATVAASVVSLDGTPDLSGVVTSGATQDTIYLNDATNANRKIFWITAVDDVLKTVTVDVAPTGITSSAWAIGGRHVYTKASVEGALRAGDTMIFNNSPATHSGSDFFTARTAGSSASGMVALKGKDGVRPVINVTDTNQCFDGGGLANQWMSNLQLDQDGASGNVCENAGINSTFYNVKIVDGGGVGFNMDNDALRIIACEVTGCGSNAVYTGSINTIIGNYIHDGAGLGIENGGGGNGAGSWINNVVDTMTGRGMYLSGAPTNQTQLKIIAGNTVYGCGNSGLEIDDQDQNIVLINNIFSENGNAAGEYNVEWVNGTAERVSFHAWNVFYHSGGGGGANLSNLTVNSHVSSSEFTTDPSFTDAAGSDFSIGSTSPAKAAGFPGAFLGSSSTGYLDIGAVQRQEAGGGGLLQSNLRGNFV